MAKTPCRRGVGEAEMDVPIRGDVEGDDPLRYGAHSVFGFL